MCLWVERLGHFLADKAIWTVVVILSTLILHRGALHLKFLLGNSIEEEAHAVGLQPKGGLQLIAGNGLKIVGAVGIGGSIQISA